MDKKQYSKKLKNEKETLTKNLILHNELKNKDGFSNEKLKSKKSSKKKEKKEEERKSFNHNMEKLEEKFNESENLKSYTSNYYEMNNEIKRKEEVNYDDYNNFFFKRNISQSKMKSESDLSLINSLNKMNSKKFSPSDFEYLNQFQENFNLKNNYCNEMNFNYNQNQTNKNKKEYFKLQLTFPSNSSLNFPNLNNLNSINEFNEVAKSNNLLYSSFFPISPPSTIKNQLNHKQNSFSYLYKANSYNFYYPNSNFEKSKISSFNNSNNLNQQNDFFQNSYHNNLNFNQQIYANNNLKKLSFLNENDFLNSLKDRDKCRELTNIILKNTNFACNTVFPIIKKKILEISTNPYLNFFLQSLISMLGTKELYEFIITISNEIVFIGMNQYGTRVIQKLIIELKTKNLKNLLISLIPRNCYLALILDKNANYLIKKIFKVVKGVELSPFHETFIKHLDDIVKDIYGSCVMQCFLESCENWFRELLISNMINNISKYINHPYANYVIQSSMDYSTCFINSKILEYVKSDLIYLCLEKHSCHIIEKALNKSNKEIVQSFFDIIIDDETIIKKLLFSIYGNHILHTTIKHSNNNSKTKIIKVIIKNKKELQENLPYGKVFLGILRLEEKNENFNEK